MTDTRHELFLLYSRFTCEDTHANSENGREEIATHFGGIGGRRRDLQLEVAEVMREIGYQLAD